MTAIFPGSFDPVTYGHLDLINRGAKLFDNVIVAVLNNPAKTSLFTAQERIQMLEDIMDDIPNTKVETYDGLLVDFAKLYDAQCILRGIRSETDSAYELPRAQANRNLGNGLETIMLATDPAYTYISASLVREVISAGGIDNKNLSQWVPSTVIDMLHKKVQNDKHKRGIN